MKNSARANSKKLIQRGKLSVQALLENLQDLLEINILLLVGKHELFDIIWEKNAFFKIVALIW